MENKANLRTGSVNDETGKKRLEVVKWLNSLFPDLNLPLNATDEDLRSELFDGVILCAILNRKNLGSVQSQRGVFISSELRLYNVKRFLSAMDDMCLPKFNVSDLEQGYMSAVLDCLLSLKNRMNSSKGIDDGKCDAIKFGSLMFHKEILDVKQGKHIHSEPNSPLSVDERRRSFADNALPSHMSGKSDVFQLKQGRYSDLNPDKLMDMMKSTSLDNAPTQSLLSVVNGILDESIERKNGEIPYRVTCLLRKAIQEIERRISTQADHIRSQNNLIKAREDKYQSRIKVLETLASGASDETQISYQLEKIKIGKTRPEENKNSSNQEMNKLMKEKELNSESTISELKKELQNVKNLYESKTEDSKNNSNQEFDKLRKEKEDSDHMILELKKELENVKNQYKTRTEESKGNNSQEIDKLKKEKESSDHMISELKQELENAKNLFGSSDHKILELKQELEKAKTSYDNSQCMIAELKNELEKTKESYENRYQQLEKDSKNIRAQLEEKIKQSENLLEESKKRTKEIEEISESNSQNWIRKEHIYQNFVGRQMQSVKNIKLTSESVKQEVRRIQEGWRDEITKLGEKLQVLVDAAQNYHAVLSENQKLYNEVLELKGNIRVYCRVRPFLPGQSGRATSVEYVGNDGEVVVANPSKQGKDGRKMFKFTKGFGPVSTQAEVYSDIQPLVRSVLDGYNVCIFAYGQTGSGKTYTMNGPNSPTKEEYGVNYRALNDLFDISCNRGSTFTYEIGVQMVEIYNEQVRDLLTSDSSKKLGILNSMQPNGLAVPDASMLPVNSTSDVLDIMQFGFSNRAMSSTAMNERSSRSHSVVTIIVKCLDLKTGSTSQGCLHLIDLAGSERVDRSEVKGDRLKEAQHINKSLSALGDVIFALAQKSNHVPYRNSKLTQLLQSSLGGHAKTLMFVQVNPDADSYSETLSTLKFAERVSGVELGTARSNKEGKDVRDLMEQVNSLKETLAKKDDEIEELQLKSIKVGASSGTKTLKHSVSSPGIASPSRQFSPRLSSGRVAKFAEKASSDQENSDISDRQSENSSQLSGENSEGRQSDTDVSNSLEKTKEKISKVSTRLTKPLLSKTGQGQTTTSIRSKLKVKSPPVMKKSTSSLTTTKTKPKTFK